MTVVNPWSLALPEARAADVVRTLVEGFTELSAGIPEDFRFDRGEPDITKRLTRHLQTILPLTLVTGFWNFEVSTVAKDMTDSRRLDISYTTVWEGKDNVLMIFECKKLYNGTDKRSQQYRRRYIDEGIYRFVKGSYAPDEPVGFMVGFVNNAAKGTVPKLVSSLAKGAATVLLGLRQYAPGRYWLAPPLLFVEHAAFETCHQRDKPFPEITLYHLELAFPPGVENTEVI